MPAAQRMLVPVALVALACVPVAFAGERRDALAALAVPEGFVVERVAGPPLVDRPIVAAFDEAGRLYVADSAGVNDNVRQQLEERPHRVVRLEDTDGDGTFDARTVFADRLMFPEGAMWLAGSLYVAAPPSIWRLSDVDGDGVCDEREEWFQGETLTGCANDLHGPYAGPDGWIYWCKGAFAEQTHARADGPPLVTRAAHIFRRRPEGGFTEAVMTGGMDNPVDVVFLPSGERFFTTTFFQHPGGGRRDGLVHAIYGGVYGKRHGVLDGHKRTGDLMPVMTHLGPAAPCGFTRYRSDAFGPGYRNNLFACLFNLHKVTRHVLESEGATYRTEDSDFLVSSDTDFHPTDVIEDADGSLLVVDTGGWYKLCCPTSQLHKPDVLGAIYRVRRGDAAPLDDPRGRQLAWDDLDTSGLVALLADARTAVRDRAVARLASLGRRAAGALAACVEKAAAPQVRQRAVWTLARIDAEEARSAVRSALADGDAGVRHTAAHAAGLWRDARALPGLLACLDGGPDAVRRSAAEAIGRLGDPAAVPVLLAAAAEPVDRVLEHSLIYALIELEAARETRAGLSVASAAVRRAALVALDQMESGVLEAEQVLPLLDAGALELRRAALEVVARRPQWAPQASRVLAERLRLIGDATDERASELAASLASLAAADSVQALLAAAVAGESEAGAIVALRAMAGARLGTPPRAWAEAIVERLRAAGTPPDVLVDAVAAAERLRSGLDDSDHRDDGDALTAALARLARDETRAERLRLDALAAVARGGARLDDDLFAMARARIGAETPAGVRALAAAVLTRVELDERQRLDLAGALAEVGPLELRRLFGVFEEVEAAAVAGRVLESLARSTALAALPSGTLEAWIDRAALAGHAAAGTLLARRGEDDVARRGRLDELAAAVRTAGGDVRRGQKVFNSERTACRGCHAMGYLGGDVGPDLTRIGTIRNERDLLEAIVYPSASFVRSYEPVVVVTRDGEVLSGVLRDDAAQELLLATGVNTVERIPRDRVLEIRPGETSIMPAALETQLSTEELADLIAFLRAAQR